MRHVEAIAKIQDRALAAVALREHVLARRDARIAAAAESSGVVGGADGGGGDGLVAATGEHRRSSKLKGSLDAAAVRAALGAPSGDAHAHLLDGRLRLSMGVSALLAAEVRPRGAVIRTSHHIAGPPAHTPDKLQRARVGGMRARADLERDAVQHQGQRHRGYCVRCGGARAAAGCAPSPACALTRACAVAFLGPQTTKNPSTAPSARCSGRGAVA